MSHFGQSAYTSKSKNSNAYMDSKAFTATASQTVFNLPFQVSTRNVIVFVDGEFQASSKYNVVNGRAISFLVGIAVGKVVTVMAVNERSGDSYTRTLVYFDPIVAGTEIEIGFDFNPLYLSVLRNGLEEYVGTGWSQSGTKVVFSEPYEAGDRFLIYNDLHTPSTAQTTDWDNITNKPTAYPPVQNTVNSFISTLVQNVGVGLGTDYIKYSSTQTLKELLEELKQIDPSNYILKAGDDTIGLLSGTEFRLDAKGKFFRTHYNTAADFSGIKANANGEVTVVQGASNPVDTFTVKANDVWHKEIGNFKDFFYPKSGMLYSGIGAYSLWVGDPDLGTLVTPPGWTGSWRVQGVLNKGLSTKMALLVRIV